MGGFNCATGGEEPQCFIRCCRIDFDESGPILCCMPCTCCYCCCMWPWYAYLVHKALKVDFFNNFFASHHPIVHPPPPLTLQWPIIIRLLLLRTRQLQWIEESSSFQDVEWLSVFLCQRMKGQQQWLVRREKGFYCKS